MKKNNPLLLFVIFNLVFLMLIGESYSITFPSTSGIIQPSKSPSAGMILPTPPKSETTPTVPGVIRPLNPPPICVDSGAQGRRCGISAVTFCKLNPDALNCNTLNNSNSVTK
jgi:hypothetical protein